MLTPKHKKTNTSTANKRGINSGHLQTLVAQAALLEDQSKAELSKPVNFYLDYKTESGAVLDTMISEIVKEIEASERTLPPSDNGRYPRKNKRAAVPNRRFRKAVRVLILNLLQAYEFTRGQMHLAMAKDANFYNLKYRYSPPDMTYDTFIEAYDGLVRLEYATLEHEGFYDPASGAGWSTRINASPKLIKAYQKVSQETKLRFFTRIGRNDKDELIILRKEDASKRYRNTDYKDTRFTKSARSNLNKINKVLSSHDIALDCTEDEIHALRKRLFEKSIHDTDGQLPYLDLSANRLYRIFSDGSFEKGGRFYRAWWLNLPKEYRKRITIDGYRTVELDYSRYHINMLYAETGLRLTHDPYKVHAKVSEEITKKTVNALLNSKGMIKPQDGFDEEQAGISWPDFVELILAKHPELTKQKRFMSGYGLRLQYLDSEIAEAVMLHFCKQKIPCLPVHDSFIVADTYKEELQEIMQLKYTERFHQPITIKEA